MDKQTAERVVQLMNNTSQIDTVDLTGKCHHIDTMTRVTFKHCSNLTREIVS
mgnify:CR=1 FL=1